MKLIKSILTKNPCYIANKKIKPQGLMLHSVGTPQPKASVFLNNWNKASAKVCVHGFIEPNGNFYQTLPWDHRGWHCGKGNKGSGNDTHIGIEMTEPNTIKYTGGASWTDLNPAKTKEHVLATYKTAVESFAHLCKELDLDPLKDGVIISHSEGHKRGIASNHGDVEHLWSKFGLSIAQFRKDIKKEMEPKANVDGLYRVRKSWTDSKSQLGAFSILSNAVDLAKKNKDYKVFDTKGDVIYPATSVQPSFLVKVTADGLNIRKGPGTNYSVVGVIRDKGTYTIVETSGRWGKLKSGAGWISLDYTKRV